MSGARRRSSAGSAGAARRAGARELIEAKLRWPWGLGAVRSAAGAAGRLLGLLRAGAALEEARLQRGMREAREQRGLDLAAKRRGVSMAAAAQAPAAVPEVRAAARVSDEALWFRAARSGSVPTWGFAVDLRGGSHVAEHGSGLGTFFESQFGWDAQDGDVACIETGFKLHDAKELQGGASAKPTQEQPTAVPVPPVKWHARGASVRPDAPLEIGVADLEVAATPQSERTATRITQGALEAQGAASAASALRRLQLRALPTIAPFLALRPSPASLHGRQCLSIRHARKLMAEPAFVQQLQAQIQRYDRNLGMCPLGGRLCVRFSLGRTEASSCSCRASARSSSCSRSSWS